MADSPCKELRMVLLGKTGSGKSACGNRILSDPRAFKSMTSPLSVTRHCKKATGTVDNVPISVIDTPGIFGTEMGEDAIKKEVGRCIELSLPGPHAFLLVIRLDARFTQEDMEVIDWIEANFGEGARIYTIVLFTHADEIKMKSVEDYIKDSKDIVSVITSCGLSYHVLNSNDDDNVSLMKKVKTVVENNGGKYYRNDKYQKAQQRLKDKNLKERMMAYVLLGATIVVGATVVGGTALGVTAAAATIAFGTGKGLIRFIKRVMGSGARFEM